MFKPKIRLFSFGTLRSLIWGSALLVLGAHSAQALEPPTGKIVLTLSGKVGEKNTPKGEVVRQI